MTSTQVEGPGPMTSYQTLRIERSGRIATLTLDRPGRRNALSREMLGEVHHAVTTLSADTDLSVLVMTGAGGDFCPGADLKGALTADGVAPPPVEPELCRVGQMLHESPLVTIAAISGACAGAGFSWACACDLRIASDTARFNTAFLDVGTSGDMGGIWFATRLLGAAKARELFLSPGKFLAAEALRIGLVSAVYDPADFPSAVAALVARLAAVPPQTLVAMKANFIDAGRLEIGPYLTLETQRHLEVMGSAATRAAFRAKAGAGS